MINHSQIGPNALFTFIVQESNVQQRIDKYLTSHFPHYSRSFFQTLIQDGCVKRNDVITTKPSTPTALNDIVTIQFPPARTIETNSLIDKTMDVSILAETEHFMIIYKPPHLLVHAPSKASPAITLTDWIIHNHNDIAHVGIVDRPCIVHRLDKETSGIMIITRTNYAHTVFNSLFKKREIHKTYLAIVAGHPEQNGTITHAIGRDPFNRIKMTHFDESLINENNMVKNIKVRHATSNYAVVTYFQDSTLIEVKPTTGRTHQIRVHMAAIGNPIIGDQLYGKKSMLIDRQALHAYSLSFIFDEKPYQFSVNAPQDFQELINNLKPLSNDQKKL